MQQDLTDTHVDKIRGKAGAEGGRVVAAARRIRQHVIKDHGKLTHKQRMTESPQRASLVRSSNAACVRENTKGIKKGIKKGLTFTTPWHIIFLRFVRLAHLSASRVWGGSVWRTQGESEKSALSSFFEVA